VTALLGAMALSSVAEAQTLRMMKSLDAPHYDGQRTTWSPTSDIVNMIQDTLVALDWDGKTRTSPSRGPSAPTARSTPSSCATT
jgi:peptide/nickel transport system substrate-binding protein